jgi:serine/threonine protein kinase
MGFVYRDLKPENVLFDDNGHVKLTDFGYAKNLQGADRTSSFCGTADYLAPEILKSQAYGKSVDWWSLGCVIYEMLVSVSPFYNPHLKRMYRAIVNDEVKFPGPVSPLAKDLISKLLNKDPDQRLGNGTDDAKEIQGHPFFSTINWQAVFERKVEPLWKPQIRSPMDVSNFSQEFTAEDPIVSYTPPPVIVDENYFAGWDDFSLSPHHDKMPVEDDDEESD